MKNRISFVPRCPECDHAMVGSSGPEPDCIGGWACLACGNFMSDAEAFDQLADDEMPGVTSFFPDPDDKDFPF